jgi:hypothetical protein
VRRCEWRRGREKGVVERKENVSYYNVREGHVTY